MYEVILMLDAQQLGQPFRCSAGELPAIIGEVLAVVTALDPDQQHQVIVTITPSNVEGTRKVAGPSNKPAKP